MNSLITQQYPVLKQTLVLRRELLDSLTDEDLKFALPNNMTLGELCRQQGEIDHSYINAFQTFTQDWSYQHPDKSVETSVESLRAWYTELEAQFKAAVGQLTEEQVQSQIVNRGTGFDFPVGITFHVYRESLIIFYAKAGIYLRALNKPLSPQWQQWIG